ncbi:MAG: translation initiation factor IF-3 [Limnohabitans sp.]|nr:translation initiation factor IF-3 [Limnohabitans sp.]
MNKNFTPRPPYQNKNTGGGPARSPFQARFNNKKEPEFRINEFIRVPNVRLVGENIEVGVYSTFEAIKIARNLGLDLVEISPNADPPICKAIDYKKFLYEKKRKEKEIKANSFQSEVKEIRFTPSTDVHDFEFKSKHAETFLKEGDKVKAYIQFKGRAIQFKERGELMLLKLAEKVADYGQPETLPKLEGKRMFLLLTPKSNKKKKDTPDATS